jgi:uncharacterized protein YkwD
MFRRATLHLSRAVFAGLLVLVFTLQPALASDLAGQLPGDPRVMLLLPAEQALLELTNADRVANGLEPLDFDPETLAIARQRAASQLTTPTLTHYDANGELAFVNLLADAEITYQLAGENLARASADDATVSQRVEQALMKSPTHRKNILERGFRRVAIGVATDSSGQITFAEVYRS